MYKSRNQYTRKMNRKRLVLDEENGMEILFLLV
jgi:hypothetical protein